MFTFLDEKIVLDINNPYIIYKKNKKYYIEELESLMSGFYPLKKRHIQQIPFDDDYGLDNKGNIGILILDGKFHSFAKDSWDGWQPGMSLDEIFEFKNLKFDF